MMLTMPSMTSHRKIIKCTQFNRFNSFIRSSRQPPNKRARQTKQSAASAAASAPLPPPTASASLVSVRVDYRGRLQSFRVPRGFVFGDLGAFGRILIDRSRLTTPLFVAIDAAFFFGVRDDCVLRDADGSVWPNSAEIGALLSADSAATLFLSPVVSSIFSSTSNAIHVGNDDDFAPSSASTTVPEPFVTPAKSELFSLDKRRTDSLFRLPEPSLLSQERPSAVAATVVAAASTTSNGTFVHPTPQPPTRRNSGHPRDVFMLAFGGSVHRITVPPSAQLPVAALLRHTIVDSSGTPFEYQSPSAAHTGGAGSWALVELPAAISASAKGGVRLLDATDEHVFALTGDGLLYRWPLTVKGSFGGARALPRPVARETGGSGAMRFQSLSCGATMALAVTSDGLVCRVGRDADVVPKVPSVLPGALDGADDADLVATWADEADERSPDGAASSSAVGSLLLAARVQLPTSVRVSKVVCGEAHRLLLTTGGSVYAFGDGKYGRLGLGDERSSGVARCVVSLSSRRCVDIAVGAYHSAAVVDDGRLLTWGHGKYGQLGHGTQDNEFSPREVSAVSQHRIVRVVASTMFTAVLTVNGDVYTCGFPMTPAEDASKYSGAVLSSSPRLALSGMHIVQLGASLAGGLFAVSGTIEGASDKNPVELN